MTEAAPFAGRAWVGTQGAVDSFSRIQRSKIETSVSTIIAETCLTARTSRLSRYQQKCRSTTTTALNNNHQADRKESSQKHALAPQSAAHATHETTPNGALLFLPLCAQRRHKNHIFLISVSLHPTLYRSCLLYTSPSPRDGLLSRMPSSA